ncbi:MAG: rRNA maturation RNAse YbeY [Candidatus Fermentibacter sp.]|nr:rRNA maturation RNAse YbeY [Candidatus Fermentibacter sp.]
MADGPVVETPVGDPGFDPEELRRMISPRMHGDVEIVLVDPGYMRVMNRRFRHIDRYTDVLTFDLSEGGADPEGVIYADMRLAPPMEELLERIFHGYLHLLGRTHDTEADSASMAADVASMVAGALEGAR